MLGFAQLLPNVTELQCADWHRHARWLQIAAYHACFVLFPSGTLSDVTTKPAAMHASILGTRCNISSRLLRLTPLAPTQSRVEHPSLKQGRSPRDNSDPAAGTQIQAVHDHDTFDVNLL